MYQSFASKNKNPVKQNDVDVLFYYDSREQYARPVRLLWDGIEYELGGVQFWFTARHEGRLTHHYRLSDVAGHYTFQLAFDTEDLSWKLEQAESDIPETATDFAPTNLVGAMG